MESIKNDGLITPESCLWDKSDSLNDEHNKYYSDEREEGGYNHSELKRYIRAYSVGEGDITEPWKMIKEWLKEKVFKENEN